MKMQDYLQCYQMKITALSPIFIGDGKTIYKREYIQNAPEAPVLIPDLPHMYHDLCELHKDTAYEMFLTGVHNQSLSTWLRMEGIGEQQIQSWIRYSLDPAGSFIKADGSVRTPKQIATFVKDAYGLPYVPGSAIKGMIRTALLTWIIKNNPQKFEEQLEGLRRAAQQEKRDKKYLRRETRELETMAFHSLGQYIGSRIYGADLAMRGLLVGDSEPISLDQLFLSQRVAYNLEGEENSLILMQEALRPGTEINFDITIDRTTFPYSLGEVMDALESFQQDCYSWFYSKFGRGTKEKGVVWLGGGAGFPSKTVLYSLYGADAVSVINDIYQKTLGSKYVADGHNQDVALGVAPHVCKCTRYKGVLYDMGMGRITVRT